MGGHVKYGGGQGKLAKAAAAASSGNQSVSAIGQVRAYIRYCCRLDKAVRFRSMSFVQRLLYFQMYSDAGLLGAMVVCEASSAGKVVGAVAAALRNAQVSLKPKLFVW